MFGENGDLIPVVSSTVVRISEPYISQFSISCTPLNPERWKI
jgi:hypothetical protein